MMVGTKRKDFEEDFEAVEGDEECGQSTEKDTEVITLDSSHFIKLEY